METCKALASAGCKVILCSRSVPAGEAAIREEIAQPGHGGYAVDNAQQLVVVKALDLESLESIKAFADEVTKDQSLVSSSIDLLVLNAGIMALPALERTRDAGFEKQIGVNHFVCTLLYCALYVCMYVCTDVVSSYICVYVCIYVLCTCMCICTYVYK